jgi:polysaccharide deacetylase 2 family uncharacterized protein YibQ
VAKAGAQVIGRFLLGSGLGALVGTGLLALASVISPAPEGATTAQAGAPMPDAVAVDPEVAPAATADLDAEGPVVAEGGPEPAAAMIDPDEEAAPAGLATAPVAPDADQAGARVETGPDVPAEALAPLAGPAPDAPADLAGDAAPVPAEQPAAAPDVVAAEAPAAPVLPDQDIAENAVPEPGPATLPDLVEQPGASSLAEAPVSDAAPAPTESPAAGPAATPPVAEDLAVVRPGETTPEGEAQVPTAIAEAPQAPESADEPPSQLTEVEDERVIRTGDGESTLPPTPSLAEAAEEGVLTDRLPRIGAGDGTGAAGETEEALLDTRPIAAFARAFDNPEGKPAFAIVLIDEGGADLDRAALAALPFAVSFALDPTDPRAADHAAIYRGAGQEVVMLATALPKGGQASDIEVALSAMATALPEAVAVMDLADRVFQADRPMATLVVPVVGAAGRGLLTWDQGLNAADQVARREAVPAAVVFRDLDGAGESAPVIRRYLDRAAFKAVQEGRVTVVGRARPETVAALLEWAVEGRAATVALAPLTAVLTVN